MPSFRKRDFFLLFGIPLLMFLGFWVESGSDTAMWAAAVPGFNLGLIFMVWSLWRAHRSGIVHTRGGGHYDRTKEPYWFRLTFGAYALATVLIFAFAMITDVLFWSELNGS